MKFKLMHTIYWEVPTTNSTITLIGNYAYPGSPEDYRRKREV